MIKKNVSVIIPVYNVERYLRESLLSVMNQDYEELEIVVVNDGSTDSSLEILKDLALKDSRVKIFSKTNGGLASARNYGLKHCSGDFILPIIFTVSFFILIVFYPCRNSYLLYAKKTYPTFFCKICFLIVR